MISGASYLINNEEATKKDRLCNKSSRILQKNIEYIKKLHRGTKNASNYRMLQEKLTRGFRMISHYTSLAFLFVLLIPIAIFFLTLIQLTIEDVRSAAKVRTLNTNTYRNQEISTPRLRVVK